MDLLSRISANMPKMMMGQLLLLCCCFTIARCAFTMRLLDFPVTKNDVRFSLSRCQDEYSKWDQGLRSLWIKNEYPDEPRTHCYVKCFLTKLGLIDPQTNGLHFKRLIEIWANMDVEIAEMCPPNFRLDADLDGKCVSYYRQWLELREKCGDLMKYVFFEMDIKKSVKYRVEIQSKPLGVSAREYCAAVPKQETNAVQTTTKYLETIATPFRCRMSCVFRQFRYFDGYGRVDSAEIVRSFEESHHLTLKNRLAITNCTNNANVLFDGLANCKMSVELRNCLQKTTDDFQKVYVQRDMTSRLY